LNGQIGFTRITELIEEILVKHNVLANPGLDDILHCDQETRRQTAEMIGRG
jgi:1-deoxy-D-xylulose 5-phosphate reductoisomerase